MALSLACDKKTIAWATSSVSRLLYDSIPRYYPPLAVGAVPQADDVPDADAVWKSALLRLWTRYVCCQAHVQVHLCPHELVHWPAAVSAMANLDLTGIDKILDLWNWAKGQEAVAKKED